MNSAVFFSYTRRDDQAEGGYLSQIRERLQTELIIQSGCDEWSVFQDVEDVQVGQQWQKRLDDAVLGSTFFVPVVTPSYLKRKACRDELTLFLKREEELGQDELVLPILHIETPAAPDDELSAILQERQHADWTALRGKRPSAKAVKDAITKLARAMVERHRSMRAPAPPPAAVGGAPAASAAAAAVAVAHEAAEKTRMTDDEWLTLLTERHPLHAALQEETRHKQGVTEPLAQSLVQSSIPCADHERMLMILASRTSGRTQYGVANLALRLVARRGCAQAVVDFCLRPGALSAQWREILADCMPTTGDTEAYITWCHEVLVRKVKLDRPYAKFLQRHGTVVATRCLDDMAAYLLHPDRGPGGGNLAAMIAAILRAEKPEPFVLRLVWWIREGLFDGGPEREGQRGETPTELYIQLGDLWQEGLPAPLEPIHTEAHNHVYGLIKRGDDHQREDYLVRGFSHLAAMIRSRYPGAAALEHELPGRIYDMPAAYRASWDILCEGLRQLVCFTRDPNGQNKKRLHQAEDAVSAIQSWRED